MTGAALTSCAALAHVWSSRARRQCSQLLPAVLWIDSQSPLVLLGRAAALAPHLLGSGGASEEAAALQCRKRN
jgi:hypothetical protein